MDLEGRKACHGGVRNSSYTRSKFDPRVQRPCLVIELEAVAELCPEEEVVHAFLRALRRTRVEARGVLFLPRFRQEMVVKVEDDHGLEQHTELVFLCVKSLVEPVPSPGAGLLVGVQRLFLVGVARHEDVLPVLFE